MIDAGFGEGYETTRFDDEAAHGSRRIAACVFWRGGGLPRTGPFGRHAASVHPQAFGTTSSTGSRLTLPLRFLLLAVFLPFAWVADQIIAYRKDRRRKPHKYVPMSAVVETARRDTRYEAGVLTIGSRKLKVPEHTTLVVFVEEDPSQDDHLAITTHRIATEPFTPGPRFDISDRDAFRRAAKDPKTRDEVLKRLQSQFKQGPAQMFLALHQDPVCQEFMRRAAGQE